MQTENNLSGTPLKRNSTSPFKNRRFIALSLIILIVIIAAFPLFILSNSNQNDSNPIVIAMVGGFTGSQSNQVTQIKQTLDLKVNEVNRNGGLNGHQIKLEFYDDKTNPNEAVIQAKKIAASRAVLVLGHQVSLTSVPSSPVYREAGLPAITGTATTEEITLDNPYFFRTIAVNGDESKAISAFSQQVLKVNTATVIYDDSVFGLSVLNGLKAAYNGRLRNTLKLETAPDKQEQSAQAIAEALAADPNPGVVCLAMLDTNAMPILLAAKQRGVQVTFFGTDFLGTQQFNEDFKKYAEQKGYSNLSIDGLYALAPLLFDSSRVATQNLAAQYLKTYGQPMEWPSAKFYEALLVGLQAVQTANIQNTPQSLKQDRQKIKDSLAAINSSEKGVPGLEGPIFFDNNRNSTQPFKVGYFNNGKFISAPVQLQLVSNLALVNLKDEIKAGRIIQLGNQYVWLQRVVYAGLDVNQINRIDVSKSSFTADVYFWLRYYGENDATEVEFADAPDFNSGLKTPLSTETINGLNYRLYRLRGDIRTNYDLHDYPFDKQTLNLRFRNTLLNNEQLVYAIDTFGLKLSSTDQSKATDAFASIQTWRFLDLKYGVESFDSSSTRGDPRLFNSNSNIQFSGLNTVIKVERNYQVFLVKSLLPLALLTIILYASLYFPTTLLKEQATVPVTGTLTGVVLLNAINGQLTDVGYTVAIEYLFYLYFAICLSCILIAVIADRLDNAKRLDAAQRVRIGFRIFFPIVVITIITFYWVSYINR